MKIYGSFTEQVKIDPKDVINKLIENEIGYDSWVFEENDKYYCGFEEGCGSRTYNSREEISKEKYDYVKALEFVLKYMEKKQ